MTAPHFRAARAGDLERLHEIRTAAYQPVFASFRAIVGEEIAPHAFPRAEAEQGDHLNEIADQASDFELHVVCLGEEIVGFVALSCDDTQKLGEIGLNAVHPDHAGQGIGTAMYEFALDRLRELGMEAATVGTGGDPSHAPARRAYDKAGFSKALPSVWLYRKL
ncbi:MAG: N-acetyltransferase family protein [Parasphingopyxis sp.]|nr:GNAT family N-acetyltransferase [Sphingomonadales bacterium]